MGNPKGCGGVVGQGRRSVLKGTYILHAGKFFGKITQNSFRATLWNGGPTRGCSPRPHYELFTKSNRPYVAVSRSRGTGRVSEAIGVMTGNATSWGIAYSYLVTGEPGRDYKVGSKISSATVTGAGGISGTATYSAKKGRPRQITGTLSGSLTVTMAAIDRVRPFAKGPRDAVQRLFGAI